jgi:hypothetical protein
MFVAVRVPSSNLVEVARGVVFPYAEEVRGPSPSEPMAVEPLPWASLHP